MRKKLTLAVLGALIAVTPVESQGLQTIADGVHVLTLSAVTSGTAQNIGVVEFDGFLLAIDACEERSWDALDSVAQALGDKPIRFLVHTRIMPADVCDVKRQGLTVLSPNAPGHVKGTAKVVVASGDITLGDGTNQIVLRSAIGQGGGGAWILYVVNSKVLFAGDLVGKGRGAIPLQFDDWTYALQLLERMSLDVVVPGNGLIGGTGMVRDTHVELKETRARISELVNQGTTRRDAIAAVEQVAHGQLPEGAIQFLYDEYVGIRPAIRHVESLGLREGPSPTAGSAGWAPPQKVVVADLWPGRTDQIGLAAPGVEVLVARNREHAAELVEDADAILGWLTPEILANGQNLRWVSLYSAGIESYLKLPGFAESEIVLTNGQRLYAQGGAEHVLGMMLALSRRLHTALHLQSERRWDTSPLTGPTPVTGNGSELGELRGKTILVAGLGGIGTEVARLAHGIGMRVLATRASRREGPSFVDYVGLAHELLSLAPQADVIVNSLPLTPETEQTFDDEFFSVTKPTAFYVNIGRGKTVDTNALVEALRNGRIAGAGLDVTEPEPLPSDHELWSLPNVIITPHVGGDSERHMERIWILFRENLRRFAVGEPLLSVVNKRRGY